MSATLVGTIRGFFAIANLNSGLAPFLTNNRGFKAPVVRNGNGDYTLETQDGLAFLGDGGGVPLVQVYGNTPGSSSVEQVDATHLRVRITGGGEGPFDPNFGIAIQDVGPV